jgi:hypothetical protein
MRSMNIISAAAGLALALATGASAAPISPDLSFGAPGAAWNAPSDFPPRPRLWGLRHGHHRLHGKTSQNDPLTSWFCGGPDGSQEFAEDPRDQESDGPDAGEGDESPTVIAADLNNHPQQPMVPAVPEPGSLALLGAGALGLLAAHALLKKPQ